MNNTSQSGFGILQVLILIVALFVVLGLGFIFINKNHTSNTSTTSSKDTGSSTTFTGIYGVVTNGGCAGAVSVNGPNDCSRTPQADMIVVATNQSDKTTVSVLTDSKGNYRIATNAGTYSVSTHSAKPNVIAECDEATGVVVKAGKAIVQNFNCDNGLR